MLPVGIHSTMTVQVMTADGLTYSDKSFTLAGLKRNHHYTMSVPCNKQDGDDRGTRRDRPEVRHAGHGRTTDSISVDPQYDPDGIFDGWYFYRGRAQKRQERRRQTQERTASSCRFRRASTTTNNGAFVTAPIQCEGSKTVKVSFEVATNRALANIEYQDRRNGQRPDYGSLAPRPE